MKYFLLAALAIVTLSCNMNAENSLSVYYDTDSLMQEQKRLLAKREAQIVKRAVIDGDTSRATVVPDSLQAWDDEFQMFEKININKPALSGMYEVREYNDTQSNLKIKEFSTSQKDAEVPFLRIYYLEEPENLKIIEARYVEDNPIFKASRNLKFIFDDFTGTPLLQKYLITGSQKMILKDQVRFEIKAEIKF